MKDSRQDSAEAFLYLLEIFEREFTLVQLPIQKDADRNPLNEAGDSGWGGFRKGARGCLHRIRQHDDPCLFGLRFGARITKIFFVERLHLRVLFFLRFLIEIGDQARSMMLLDNVSHPLP